MPFSWPPFHKSISFILWNTHPFASRTSPTFPILSHSLPISSKFPKPSLPQASCEGKEKKFHIPLSPDPWKRRTALPFHPAGGDVRFLTSPGLRRHQSGEHDGISASSESRSWCPVLSTTQQKYAEQKKKKKKETVPGQMLGCQWLTGSYLSFNLSLLLSLSLSFLFSPSFSPNPPSLTIYLAFGLGQRKRMATVPELGRQLRTIPLTKGYKAQPFR